MLKILFNSDTYVKILLETILLMFKLRMLKDKEYIYIVVVVTSLTNSSP